MKRSDPRILVLRGGAIGDFVITLPALRALRERWPNAHIEMASYPRIADLARSGELVDAVISLDRADMARLFSPRPDMPLDQAGYFRSFAFIISYLYDPSGVVKDNLLAAGAKQVISGSPIVTDSHAIDQLFAPLAELAIYADGNERAQLVLSDDHIRSGRERISLIGDRVAAIHAGSGSNDKNWPLDRFVSLGNRIAGETGLTPFYILGEADSEIAHGLREQAPDAAVLSDCSLMDLAGALAASDLYVGNDSGVTHIAAAVGIPVVALFGPSDADLWCPRGTNVRLLRGNPPTKQGLAAISADAAWEQICDLLPRVNA